MKTLSKRALNTNDAVYKSLDNVNRLNNYESFECCARMYKFSVENNKNQYSRGSTQCVEGSLERNYYRI